MKLGPDRINDFFYIINTWHIKPLSSLSQIVKFSVIVCLKHMIVYREEITYNNSPAQTTGNELLITAAQCILLWKELPITTAQTRLQGMNYP